MYTPFRHTSLLLALLSVLGAQAETLRLTRHHSDSSPLVRRLLNDAPPIRSDHTGSSSALHSDYRRSDSSIGMNVDSSGGIAYTLDVLVGEGKVPVPVLVDTGSADLWVSANPCDNCTKASMVDSLVHTSDRCNLESKKYGDGSVYGCLVKTDVLIGQYQLSQYPLLAARDVEGFDGTFMSGILGLAMSKNAIDNQPTPIELMQSGGMISSPEVGFYLTREGDGSEIIFGNPHSNAHADQNKKVTLSKQDQDGLYRVNLDAFISHGQPITSQSTNMQNIEVIIDTGTTNILVSELMMDPIYSALGGSPKDSNGLRSVPCKGPDNPDSALALQFGGVVFDIKWEDLIIQETPAKDFILIGSAFLHNVYHTINAATGEVTIYGLNG
uniref:Peptidase A1 domain-containing protein n=1 Tax=Kwoniella bestiolae CBS 10118 TaxID=1296100 RepID=A0A1B9FVZ0_9TREE|nr:hypothetical protein I302_07287 [Kwoniella bestiolae CBS 10118]OCF22937.1 hypothetical protein I302_07287 [Kwoniella bestiolae CBS 10118]